MVKGISRQVIVVQAPEPKLFDQAIFILKDGMGEGITDEALLQEARKIIKFHDRTDSSRYIRQGRAFCAAAGAAAVGILWIVTAMIGYC